MPQLKLFLFGPPRLERQGKSIELSLRKALALLIYLVVTKGEFSRDALATLFWPESDQSSARANLRRTLYIINKSLGQETLLTGKETVYLNPQAETWTDVDTFQLKLREAAYDSESPEYIDPHRISTLDQGFFDRR